MRVCICAFVLTLVHCGISRGDTVVRFLGDYVGSSNQNLSGNAFIGNGVDINNDSVANDEIGGRAFNSSTPFSPSSGYSGTSATFYGGAILGRLNYSAGDTAFDSAEIEHQGPHDSVHLHASRAGDLHDLHAVFMWQQQDFLNGGQAIAFNSSSSAIFGIGSSSTENLGGAQVRLLVRDGSNNFWLSETAFTSPGANQTFTWDNSNQGFSASSDGNWASFNPNSAFTGLGAGTDLRFDQTGTFSSQKFSSITAIGIFFEQDTFHNNLDFHFERFEVSAVPEPTSLMSLSAVALIAAARLRRRAKSV